MGEKRDDCECLYHDDGGNARRNKRYQRQENYANDHGHDCSDYTQNGDDANPNRSESVFHDLTHLRPSEAELLLNEFPKSPVIRCTPDRGLLAVVYLPILE